MSPKVLAEIVRGRGLREAHPDVGAADEVDAEVHAPDEEERDREEVQDRRQDEEEFALADEVEVDVRRHQLREFVDLGRRRGVAITPAAALTTNSGIAHFVSFASPIGHLRHSLALATVAG